MDVKLGVLSAGISWWTLKIPRCPLQRVGKLLQALWNKFQIPAQTTAGKAMVANHRVKLWPRNALQQSMGYQNQKEECSLALNDRKKGGQRVRMWGLRPLGGD